MARADSLPTIRSKVEAVAPKRGLLVYPAFPADSFWSYRHILRHVSRKATCPPLGLLTFAAMMPQDEWDFDLIDLNVETPPDGQMRQRIQAADVVFASAMSIQRQSLVELLAGPAQGTDTPWVLGGPMASTYRDTMLKPKTTDDFVLHDGLDFLVWGEAAPWIRPLTQALEEAPRHSDDTPHLFIPERVLAEPDGSRRYLLDESIFHPLDNQPLPRWDLIDVSAYLVLLMQTTAGCRFRCNFCDIVQFNGGFARAKDKAAVKHELQSIYDTGFRGGIFTVDDNFVSEPQAMEYILEGIIEFQRDYDYPFSLFTQASLDLGKEGVRHLIPLMRQAGFSEVFLGIESPDTDALKAMNKIQNIKTTPETTIRLLHQHGIEVYGGFIFGTDTDSRQTADLIVDFIEKNGIVSAMTGTLIPLPHTPLYVDLQEQGRLLDRGNASVASFEQEDAIQFRPLMGARNMAEGYAHILRSLFNDRAVHGRVRRVLDRVEPHVFRNSGGSRQQAKVAFRCLYYHGFRGLNGRPDLGYFSLLLYAAMRDRKENKQVHRRLDALEDRCTEMVDLDMAREAAIRFQPDLPLAELRAFFDKAATRMDEGSISRSDAHRIYLGARDFLRAKAAMYRFPGAYLAKALGLSARGFHYRTMVTNVLQRWQVGEEVATQQGVVATSGPSRSPQGAAI